MSKVSEVLEKAPLCVLSTTNAEGKSQSALVGFTALPDYSLIIATTNTSRKYKNIASNPTVSLVIGWDDRKTVQYEGEARIISGEELDTCREKHIVKHPFWDKLRGAPVEAYMVIAPTWIRFTDINESPWLVEEMKEFA